MAEATSQTRELQEQARWRPRPAEAHLRLGEGLVAREFLPPEVQAEHLDVSATRIVQWAVQAVPWYAEQARARGLEVASLVGRAGLARLPALPKEALVRASDQLGARALPPGEREAGYTRTSGTTGQPVVVRHTVRSMGAFDWLKQREARWFRWDPMARLVSVRPLTDLPSGPDTPSRLEARRLHERAWPFVGGHYVTGPYAVLSSLAPVDEQLAFLAEQAPAYLVAQAATLEHLALAGRGRVASGAVRGCLAISQTLTPPMRASVEAAFGVPVHQNYGLNEVGLVASRCPEGGRYHVHSEHCLVELVDADDRPVRPGEQGRLLVTALTNTVMPLLRYDADDLAVAVEGPCPCGRTLPSFGELTGRYRRIAALPEGSWVRWGAVQRAFYVLPTELAQAVRRYQAVQERDGRWVLRLDAEAAAAPGIAAAVQAAFVAAVPGEAPPLEVVLTTDFLRSGGKFQSFVSEFAPFRDEGEQA